mgnify:CR=1 FL=1
MLYRDCIEKLLQLKDAIVTNIECSGEEMHIHLRMEQCLHRCPQCGTLTSKVHDYRTQLVRDVSISGYATILHLRKRRHVCPNCGKRFDEYIDFLPRYRQFTNRVFLQILGQLKECRSIKGIAADNNMSPPTAAKIVNEIDFRVRKLPEVLAIDEFKGNAEGEKFQCILADPKNRRVVDILPTRKHEMIRHHLLRFSNRRDVKFVVMDMTGGYRKLMHELFPQAKIIVDKYHYVRQISYAIERIRVEEQKRLSDKWRRYFKRSKYLLLKDTDKLTIEDRIQLDNIFRISEPLNKAYALKQQFEYVKASTSREEAAKRLSRWIMDAQRSGLKDMIKISLTYQNWSIEILNSFEYPYTNGYIEGCNNRIKVLKRVSFGMPRFVRFRRRIMHIMVD